MRKNEQEIVSPNKKKEKKTKLEEHPIKYENYNNPGQRFEGQ